MNEAARHFRAHYPAGLAALAGDGLRAVFELALANRRVQGLSVRDLLDGRTLPAPAAARPTLPGDRLLAARLAYVIPRIGKRLPWRADCLVQALAARRWLAAEGIESILRIGTRKDAAGQFDAHAWLTVGDLVVTGWDNASFGQFAEFPPQSVAP